MRSVSSSCFIEFEGDPASAPFSVGVSSSVFALLDGGEGGSRTRGCRLMVHAPNLGFAGCVFGTREQVAVTRSEILSHLQEQCQKVKHTLTPPTNCFYPVLLLRDHPKYIPNVDSFSNRWLTCVGPAFPYNRQILVYTEFQTKSAVAPIIKAGSWFEVSYSKPRPAYNGPVMVVAVLRVSLV